MNGTCILEVGSLLEPRGEGNLKAVLYSNCTERTEVVRYGVLPKSTFASLIRTTTLVQTHHTYQRVIWIYASWDFSILQRMIVFFVVICGGD